MILVDSNVLIDVIGSDPQWGPWSAAALAEAVDRDEVAINPIIYAEISIGFETEAALQAALAPAGLQQLALPYGAAFVAGKAFLLYRRRGGKRTSPLPDFYIGAHAALGGLTLLTRDGARYESYFPMVDLVQP
ncbi:MAG: PIN domain-containing protein [Gammaproteobacteria bacterium]|jgi:predicted nucleic acid-binding protein|nr:PIN domain-containing protein [Gammaproteobacteria bacterium]